MKTVLCTIAMAAGFYFGANPASAQWVRTSTPPNVKYQFNALAVSGANLYVGTELGVFLSTNNGNDWTDINAGFNTIVHALAISGGTLFAGISYGVRLTTDTGANWDAFHWGDPMHHIFVNAIAVSDSIVVAGSGAGLYSFSKRNGVWTKRTIDETSNVYALTFLGSHLFMSVPFNSLFRSSDDGMTWVDKRDGLSHNPVFSFAVAGTNLFAGTGGDGVCRSTDKGETWSRVDHNLTDPCPRAFAVKGSSVFVGTRDSGVFMSVDNGESWSTINTGLTDRTIRALAISDNYIFATTTTGIWRRPLSIVINSADRVSSAPPAHFPLAQNYPNPFNPSTTIEFSVPHAGFVTLKVFNAFGAVIGTLVSEVLANGTYETIWDASVFPGGVYFYRLEAGGIVETRKMTVIR